MPERWHREVINPNIEQTLQDLLQTSTLSDFYLAGGTGLALHLGHRRSVDLDFFSAEKSDQEVLLQKIQHLPRFSVVAKAEQTLHVEARDTKISFLGYSYPLLFPFETFLGVKVADPRDIACMKLSAIAARGPAETS